MSCFRFSRPRSTRWMAFAVALLTLATVMGLASTTALAGAETELTLLDKGSGSKHKLRIAPEVGGVEDVHISIGMEVGMKMGPTEVPRVGMPVMVMAMRTTIQEVKGNGNIVYDFELVGTDVEVLPDTNPMVVTKVRAELSKMNGLKGRVEATDRGETIETTLRPPPGADPATFANLERSMSQSSVPLPKGKVGLGARWRAVQNLEENGLTLQQTAIYTLEAIDGDELRLSMQITQSADPQDIDAPNMPPGSSVRLESLASTGQGQTTLNLGTLMPVASAMRLDMRTSMTAAAGGQVMPVDMELGLDMRINKPQ